MKTIKIYSLLMLCCFTGHSALAQTPFECDDGIFMVGQIFGQPALTMYEMQASTAPFSFNPVFPSTHMVTYNAIGYRTTDDFIYGISDTGTGSSDTDLIRLDATGLADNLGTISGLPADRYIAGDVNNSNDQLYVADDNSQNIFQIDFNTMSVINQFPNITDYRYSDIAFNPLDGMLYTISTINSLGTNNRGQLIRIDSNTGLYTPIGPGSDTAITAMGSMWFDANGTLYALDNLDSRVYQINLSTGEKTMVSNVPEFSQSDGAHCVNAEFPVIAGAPSTQVPTLNTISIILLSLLMLLISSKTGLGKKIIQSRKKIN